MTDGNEKARTREAAAGKWKSILPQVGIEVGFLDGKHHKCPRDGAGEDRFRFVNRNGTGNYFCSCSDGTKGGIALVMCCRGQDYATAAREVDKILAKGAGDDPSDKPKADPKVALRAAQESITKDRSHVDRYLAARGLVGPPTLFQAKRPYFENKRKIGTFDAMLAKIVGHDGKPRSYHVTYLNEGKKLEHVDAPRKIMPILAPLNGSAVRLFPAAEEMGVGEGIETSLAASEIFRVPTWACLNEGLLSEWIPPKAVKSLWIFGDNDPNFVGQQAAYTLARRLARTRQDIKLQVVFPTKAGYDWNDVLLAQRNE